MKQLKRITCLILITILMGLSLAACGPPQSKAEGAGKVKRIDLSLTDEAYALGVDKDNPQLLEEVNAFIAKIQTDGTLDEILDKYFGDGSPSPVQSAEYDSSKDQLLVATNASFEPFEYTLGDQHQYLGIDMELADLLAQHLGKELVILNMDFDAVCLSVGQGKADIAMAGLTINESRKAFVAFSDPYYMASQQLIALTDDSRFDQAQSAADVEAILSSLDQKIKIGVQTGTTGQFYLEGDEDWGFDGFPVTCVGYNSGSLAVQDMLNGNIHYVIIDEAPALFIVDAINEMN